MPLILTDIVDRLRDPEFFARTGRREELIAAADEIERLRKRNRELIDQMENGLGQSVGAVHELVQCER